MENERKQVLEMVAEGKVTVEEAQQLLDALNQQPQDQDNFDLPAKRAGVFRKPRMIYIEVVEHGRKKVNVRIPLALAKVGMRFVPEDVVDVAGEKINLDELFDAVKNGVVGNLVEVEDNGKQVRIYVK
ncbi:MAG: hypothetical protein ISR91_07765 [Candidatus Delongbacteria bacterium]|nr:hypothetical protein [Candidatus Delongbacteria bacterium]